MSIFTGIGTALVTPFKNDDAKTVNFETMGKLIEFQIENNVSALIICGSTGEASTLTADEQIETIRFAVDAVKKRVPVIAGASSNVTEHAAALCKGSQKAGADACLIATPYYNKTSQHGLIKHYTALASATDLPIMLYNIPTRTGLNIAPKTLAALSKIENITAVKECVLSQAAQTAALCGDRLDLYAGNDDETLPILSLGGKGCVSVLSNVAPRDASEIVRLFLAGDHAGALKLQLKYIPLINALFSDVNPVPAKEALNMMGFNAGGYRMPLCEMLDENRDGLRIEMEKVGLI